MPIILPDGRFFGTLCAIDPNPRDLGNPDTRAMFEMFAQIVGSQLDQADRLADAEARITVQQQDAELREQFIAVVGHDLRNPIANVQAGVTLLDRGQPRERSQLILQNMQSSVDRMVNMIENILDFARGRLGGGLTLQKRPVEIGPVLEQVIDELRHSNADRVITHDFGASIVLDCDPMRIAQLLSNLVGNAVTHGASDQPITIHCSSSTDCFTLAVSNGGAPIPEAARALLFHPFARGKVSNDREGLGLGLYIASQIAAAHGGNLSVTSDAGETRFAFRMPLENTVVQLEPALA
jgi:signal transduction histidine kinase